MSLVIVNDSDEIFEYRKGEQVTTMIPDPMGLSEWYGEEQVSQVQRHLKFKMKPLDFIGFLPVPGKKEARPATTGKGATKVNPCQPDPIPESSSAEIKQLDLADQSDSVSSTVLHPCKEVPFCAFN